MIDCMDVVFLLCQIFASNFVSIHLFPVFASSNAFCAG